MLSATTSSSNPPGESARRMDGSLGASARRRPLATLLLAAGIATLGAVAVSAASGAADQGGLLGLGTSGTGTPGTPGTSGTPANSSGPATPSAARPLGRAVDDSVRFAYGVGFDLGEKVRNGLATDGQAADTALILRGFEDALAGNAPAIPRDELRRVLRAVHERLLQNAATKRYAEDTAFRAAADAGLARSGEAIKKFSESPRTTELEKGTYQQVVAAGAQGPAIGDQLAEVTFTVTTASGQVVDSRTHAIMDPRELLPTAGRLLRAMKPGDHWKVAIPPEQAFGLGGEPPDIGPNEALFIDVAVHAAHPRAATTGGTR